MNDGRFVRNEFREYRALQKIYMAPHEIAENSIILFDGQKADLGDGVMILAPALKGVIQRGWMVDSSDTTSRYQPQPANISVRPSDDVNGKERRPMLLSADEQYVVSSVNDFRNKRAQSGSQQFNQTNQQMVNYLAGPQGQQPQQYQQQYPQPHQAQYQGQQPQQYPPQPQYQGQQPQQYPPQPQYQGQQPPQYQQQYQPQFGEHHQGQYQAAGQDGQSAQFATPAVAEKMKLTRGNIGQAIRAVNKAVEQRSVAQSMIPKAPVVYNHDEAPDFRSQQRYTANDQYQQGPSRSYQPPSQPYGANPPPFHQPPPQQQCQPPPQQLYHPQPQRQASRRRNISLGGVRVSDAD